MNANDVLIDLIEDNRRRLHRLLDILSEECIAWKPETGANNITVTLWHMARLFDVFQTQQAKGCTAAEGYWFQLGWAEQTGYDPRGKGLNGWGMLTGYTPDEVAALPQLSRAQALGYLGDLHPNDVYDSVKAYLTNTPIEKLEMPAAGFDGRYSRYRGSQRTRFAANSVRSEPSVFKWPCWTM